MSGEIARRGALRYLVRPAAALAHGALAPVLVFLHGFDEGAPTPIEQALLYHGPLRAEAAPQARDFLGVAPQLPRCGDLWREYVDDVRDIVRDVLASRSGDPRRVYLTGFSFGGNGVFDAALAHPGLWAALWVVDPTRVPTRPIPHALWLSIGAAARLGTERLVRALAAEPASAQATAHHVYLDEGADHVGCAALAYADARIYAWLLRHAL